MKHLDRIEHLVRYLNKSLVGTEIYIDGYIISEFSLVPEEDGLCRITTKTSPNKVVSLPIMVEFVSIRDLYTVRIYFTKEVVLPNHKRVVGWLRDAIAAYEAPQDLLDTIGTITAQEAYQSVLESTRAKIYDSIRAAVSDEKLEIDVPVLPSLAEPILEELTDMGYTAFMNGSADTDVIKIIWRPSNEK